MMDETGEGSNSLRSGKTVTAIEASYHHGETQIKIGGILWFENHSSATTDLKKLWYVVQGHADSLTDLVTMFDEEGKNAVKRYAKESNHLEVFDDNKKRFLAKVRSFFEVGENAFSLLNRAAGLKQLNSINQIFRELVLDNKPQFDQALKVANSFDDLEEIYQEVLRAKEQIDALQPIAKEHQYWKQLNKNEEQYREFRELLPIWFAQRETHLLEEALTKAEAERSQLISELDTLSAQIQASEETERTLQARYMNQGGAAIEEVKKGLNTERSRLLQATELLSQYHKQCLALGLSEISNQDDFVNNRGEIERLLHKQQELSEQAQEQLIELKVQNQRLVEQRNELTEELEEVRKRPKSNIPPKYQEFREALVNELNVELQDLPFVAEMIEVKTEERAWTGAIERALGAERLRLLIPTEHFASAKHWVNQRDNRLHVRLYDISKAKTGQTLDDAYTDGYLHKLNFEGESVYSDALYTLLIGKDRHCVDSVEALDQQPFSMTQEGLMYDQAGRFEKRDQAPLNKNWMTGFDNTFLLEGIQADLAEVEQKLIEPLAKERELRASLQQTKDLSSALERLKTISFHQVDRFSIDQQIAQAEARLRQLEAPDSELSKIKAEFEEIGHIVKEQRSQRSRLDQRIGGQNNQIADLQKQLDAKQHWLQEAPVAEAFIDLIKNLKLPNEITLAELPLLQSQRQNKVNAKLDQLAEKIKSSQGKLRSCMEKAKRADNGALAEIDTELADVGDYLKRLETLQGEDLPERQRRFMNYLNESSTQGVTQLLEKINNEVTNIKERLDLLNETLRKVEYKKGKFLQLDASEVGSDSLRQVKQAEKRLRNATLQADSEGENLYHALKSLVAIIRDAANNKRTVAAQSLLDARYRLEFFAREVDQESLQISGKIKGSQTGSGGEKEQMASYILTASLSYALSPKGASRPKYATIVLDEAFSKSSKSAASKIIHALREFGLHPLFVTPNKEMSLLRANTASAILVHRATLTSLTWQELDEIHQKHQNHQP